MTPAGKTGADSVPAAPPALTDRTADPRQALPYSVSARNLGAFTEITVRNSGTTELAVRPEEFALVVRGTRKLIHYDPHQVIIDLPQDCRVPPGGSIMGRARYHGVPDTTGHRLVFNPGGDAQGRTAVVADISGPSGVMAPPAAPASASQGAY